MCVYIVLFNCRGTMPIYQQVDPKNMFQGTITLLHFYAVSDLLYLFTKDGPGCILIGSFLNGSMSPVEGDYILAYLPPPHTHPHPPPSSTHPYTQANHVVLILNICRETGFQTLCKAQQNKVGLKAIVNVYFYLILFYSISGVYIFQNVLILSLLAFQKH